jgi:F420-0:gamma-glutamyl ligase
MEIIPIKTRILHPPKDDLMTALEESLSPLQERDIVAISSKVVAIDEGRCVPVEGNDKQTLARQEADYIIERDYWPTPLTVVKNAFIGTAGVDASNANEHYVLLPENAFLSALRIHANLGNAYGLSELGVVITDSHSSPMRRGAMGISIGYHGFNPTKNLVGDTDLFGREFTLEVANIADSIAAAANLAMGEGAEGPPAAIVRGLTDIEFTGESFGQYHMVEPGEDIFRVLYEKFIKPE